ncbi:ESX secretion-associated protein EspG [Amycolatopsis aidingensis]|uniref:ESX secretion-associated protein EspG n=1 Tax=Amycolatopsis aidingensis TaxID=2842453 RepID=UPI001C0E66B9|nr:ESX secretion-associated protein EspG [Amycolatopsis aidingensis]
MTEGYQPVPLPRLALLHTWAEEGLGEPHPVLGSEGCYVRGSVRAELARLSARWYEELGLADGGRLSPRFRRMLHTLADGAREVYCWSGFADPARDQAVLVSMREERAVRLVVKGGLAWLDAVDARRWPEEFLAVLPEVPPAPVRPVSVSRAEFEGTAPMDVLAKSDPAGELREWLSAERDAVHQLYVLVREPDGRCVRSLPLPVLDLVDHGRILTFLGDGEHGRTVNLRPRDTDEIAATLLATAEA